MEHQRVRDGGEGQGSIWLINVWVWLKTQA